MASPPTVSLIIPTYNRARYFREALQSALRQTYPSLEVLIIDDASTDETSDVVQEYADSRLRYVRQPVNRGPNANWRTGMEAANGAIYGFLADDDVVMPDYVDRLAQPLIENRDLSLAFCDHWIIDADGNCDLAATDENMRQYGRDRLTAGLIEKPAEALLIRESAYIGAVLFRKAYAPPCFLPPEARSAMGGWIFYRCVKTGRPVYYRPERLMKCRWQQGSVSRSQRWLDAMTEGNINRLRRMLEDPELTSYHETLRHQLAVHLGVRGRLRLTGGARKRARALLAEAIQINPSFSAVLSYALACGGVLGTRIARFLRRLSSNG